MVGYIERIVAVRDDYDYGAHMAPKIAAAQGSRSELLAADCGADYPLRDHGRDGPADGRCPAPRSGHSARKPHRSEGRADACWLAAARRGAGNRACRTRGRANAAPGRAVAAAREAHPSPSRQGSEGRARRWSDGSGRAHHGRSACSQDRAAVGGADRKLTPCQRRRNLCRTRI